MREQIKIMENDIVTLRVYMLWCCAYVVGYLIALKEVMR